MLKKNGTHVIYKNTLSLFSNFIIRDTKVIISFQCAYPLDMKVGLQSALRPIVRYGTDPCPLTHNPAIGHSHFLTIATGCYLPPSGASILSVIYIPQKSLIAY